MQNPTMKSILPLLLMQSMLPMPSIFDNEFSGFKVRKHEKKPKKCSLPGCEKETYHNGGYCSAQHCKEHRELLKTKTISAI